MFYLQRQITESKSHLLLKMCDRSPCSGRIEIQRLTLRYAFADASTVSPHLTFHFLSDRIYKYISVDESASLLLWRSPAPSIFSAHVQTPQKEKLCCPLSRAILYDEVDRFGAALFLAAELLFPFFVSIVGPVLFPLFVPIVGPVLFRWCC